MVPFVVILYRFLAPVLGAVILMRSLWSMLRRSETRADLGERLASPKTNTPAIWIHGASVGEMNAAKPVIAALATDRTIVVTVTTLTGRATVKGWDLANLHCHLAPLDWRWLTRRFLRRCNIRALIIVENELWPNRITCCHSAGIPVVMINARMSSGSARSWARFGTLAKNVLSPMALVSPQDQQSAARLAKLGVTENALTPPISLKALYTPNLAPLPAPFDRAEKAKTILAAATHDGEESVVLAAFKILRSDDPALTLIIAPRHPERRDQIKALIAEHGLHGTTRSQGEAPDKDVYIADTLGEMHIWYRSAGIAFIGGSLVAKGGHTPFEPVAYDCPILHGPNVQNFAEAYADLHKANATIEISDSASLAKAISTHINDHAMAARAKAALQQGDAGPLIGQIKQILDPSL